VRFPSSGKTPWKIAGFFAISLLSSDHLALGKILKPIFSSKRVIGNPLLTIRFFFCFCFVNMTWNIFFCFVRDNLKTSPKVISCQRFLRVKKDTTGEKNVLETTDLLEIFLKPSSDHKNSSSAKTFV